MPNASVPSSSPSGRSWAELVMGGPPTLLPERCDWGTGTIIGLRAVRGENRKRWVSVRPVRPSPRFRCTVVVPTAVEQRLNAPGNLGRRSARRKRYNEPDGRGWPALGRGNAGIAVLWPVGGLLGWNEPRWVP